MPEARQRLVSSLSSRSAAASVSAEMIGYPPASSGERHLLVSVQTGQVEVARYFLTDVAAPAPWTRARWQAAPRMHGEDIAVFHAHHLVIRIADALAVVGASTGR